MMNNLEKSVYVDTEMLEQWSFRMSDINSRAIDILDSYSGIVGDLENYMLGNVSDGFIKDSTNLIKKSKNCHMKMQDIDKFLIEVVNIMSNQ